jgi:hypothetical protein
MTLQQVQAAVAQLAQTIRDDAADEHEAAVVLLGAKSLLEMEWHKANQAAAEASSQLVLEKRAVESGVSVAELKDAAALALKRHPSTVTAVEVVNLPVLVPLDPPPPTDRPVTPSPAPTPKVP